MEKFGGYTTERRERLVLKKEGGSGTAFRDVREVERRDWNENVFVRTNGLRENAEKASFV